MKKILIVDHNCQMRQIISILLSTKPYHIFEAENGAKALTLARREQPDLIILDVMMPGMCGFDVCRQLKANNDTRRAYVIMLTSRSQEEDKIQAYEAGADDYWVKPFDCKALKAKVIETLEQAAAHTPAMIPHYN